MNANRKVEIKWRRRFDWNDGGCIWEAILPGGEGADWPPLYLLTARIPTPRPARCNDFSGLVNLVSLLKFWKNLSLLYVYAGTRLGFQRFACFVHKRTFLPPRGSSRFFVSLRSFANSRPCVTWPGPRPPLASRSRRFPPQVAAAVVPGRRVGSTRSCLSSVLLGPGRLCPTGDVGLAPGCL